MSLLHKYITVTIIISLSFNLVNLTGIFQFEQSVPLQINYQGEWDSLKTYLEDPGIFDYFKALGFLTVQGLALIFKFAVSLFTIYYDIMRAFMIPEAMAFTIQASLDLLVFLGIAYTVRGGG
jgi:hypothetical protein